MQIAYKPVSGVLLCVRDYRSGTKCGRWEVALQKSTFT